jgi:hypothetical protein
MTEYLVNLEGETMKPTNVLRKNNCTRLINALAEKDFQVAQLLDVLILEDNWEDDI